MYGEKNISDLLLELYEFSADGSFYEHTLSVMERYVPAMYTACARTDLINQSYSQEMVRQVMGREISHSMDDFSVLLQKHPFNKYCLSKQGAPVLSMDEIMSETEWKKTSLYNEFYTQYGVVHETVVRFYTHVQCIGFSFANEKPLPMEYRRLLNLAAPHLGNAFSCFKVLQSRALENQLSNIVFLTPKGALLEFSADAKALLDKYYPSEKRRAGLCLPDAVERWARHEILAMTNGVNKVPETLTDRKSAEQQLSISLIKSAVGWLLLMKESTDATPLIY